MQGIYCLTASGDYLSGRFGRASASQIQQVIERGWQEFQRIAQQRNWSAQPVPTNPLDFALGNNPTGGLKLQASVRDLPRVSEPEPIRSTSHSSPHNIGWLNLTSSQAAAFVTSRTERKLLPRSVIESFSQTLRDGVNGQCFDWQDDAMKQGSLYIQCIAQRGDVLTMRASGFVELQQPDRTFCCQLLGRIVYDARNRQFTRFDLVASGQRSGASQFNFRHDDVHLAPMGVAYLLHKPPVME